jgi:hypothetical protein
MLMTYERLPDERLGEDICPVLGRKDLHELDGAVNLGAANHGVARSHPFGLLRYTLAESGVHDDLGVRVNDRGASGRNAELAQENTNSQRRLRAFGEDGPSSKRGDEPTRQRPTVTWSRRTFAVHDMDEESRLRQQGTRSGPK